MDISSSKIMDKVDEHLELIGFTLAITEKDVAYAQTNGYWKSLSIGDKAKMVADIVGGRTVGFNPFPDIANYSPTFDVGKAVNKYSEIGAAVWFLGEVGITSKQNGNRGKKFAIGSALGGMFDPPGGQGSSFGSGFETASMSRGTLFAGQAVA